MQHYQCATVHIKQCSAIKLNRQIKLRCKFCVYVMCAHLTLSSALGSSHRLPCFKLNASAFISNPQPLRHTSAKISITQTFMVCHALKILCAQSKTHQSLCKQSSKGLFQPGSRATSLGMAQESLKLENTSKSKAQRVSIYLKMCNFTNFSLLLQISWVFVYLYFFQLQPLVWWNGFAAPV